MMQLQLIIEVEILDVWEIVIIGPLTNLLRN